MSGTKNRQHKPTTPQQTPLVPPDVTNQSQSEHITPINGAPEAQPVPKNTKHIFRRLSDALNLIFSGILVLATTTYTLVSCRQWNTMENQSKILQGQLSSARDSVRLTQRALDLTQAAMRNASTASIAQNDRAERLTNANEKSSLAAKQTAEAMAKTLEQSRGSLDATISNFQMEQRAWVGSDKLLWNEYQDGVNTVHAKEGEKFFAGIHFTNSGRTPAFNAKGFFKIQALKPGEIITGIPSGEEKLYLQQTTSVVQPQGGFRLDTTLPIPMTKSQIEALEKRDLIVNAFGKVTYDDVFGHHHFIKFCNFLTPDRTGFAACPYYNETDDTNKTK